MHIMIIYNLRNKSGSFATTKKTCLPILTELFTVLRSKHEQAQASEFTAGFLFG